MGAPNGFVLVMRRSAILWLIVHPRNPLGCRIAGEGVTTSGVRSPQPPGAPLQTCCFFCQRSLLRPRLRFLQWEGASPIYKINFPQDSSDCALIVTIPPEAGTFQLRDRRVCITYDNVNAAFIAAQEKVGKAPSNKLDQIVGNLGTVISETSRVLSKKFGLPSDAIANGLPLIDTTRTFIHQQCPSFLMKPSCAERR